MSLADKKIVIIGGGPAGCSAAAFALQNGFKDVTIIESSQTLGGLHKDIEINGLHFDLGAFFFWRHHNMLKLFPVITEMLVYAESARHYSLTSRHNLDHYPITLKSYLKENGYFSTGMDLVKLVAHRFSHSVSACRNVSEILNYYMGPFYQKSGLRHYIKRLYNVDPENISTEFAEKRLGTVINKFRTGNMFRALIRGNFTYFRKYEIIQDTWARPECGFESIYEVVQQQLTQSGCRVVHGEKVEQIDPVQKCVRTSAGDTFDYDYLFSSQPLASTAAMAGHNRDFNLKYRPLCSLFYEAPEPVMPDCFALFNFSSEGKWKRASFHSNYYNRSKTDHSNLRHYFVVESMPDNAEVDEPEMPAGLDQDFKNTFVKTRWEQSMASAKLVGHHITKNAYPVFDLEFRRSDVLDFKETMKKENIYIIGRQGEFEHNSSSDASRSAILALTEIINDFSRSVD